MTQGSHSSAIEDILNWLSARLDEDLASAEDPVLTERLIKLKELSRVKGDAESIYSPRGIKILLKFACGKGNLHASREAKRCLANAMTLEDRCVPLFVQNEGLSSLLQDISRQQAGHTYEDEFLVSRIMFLVTAKAGSSVGTSLQHNHNAWVAVLDTWLKRHSKWIFNGTPAETPANGEQSLRVSSLCETLKFVYNLSLYAPSILKDCRCEDQDRQGTFMTLTETTMRIIYQLNESKKPIVKIALPLSINLLANIEIDNTPKNELIPLFSVLEQFVDAILQNSPWYGMVISEDQLAPLLTVLARFHTTYAPDQQAKDFMASHLLVNDAERSKPLGRTDTGPSKLLRLFSSSSEVIRECVGALLFQISGSAQTFVENVGYGHAIGFLTAHGIAIPHDQVPDSHHGQSINPITGQNLRDEAADHSQQNLRDMTDEEKEREAEKLFVLFQRMKKNGIINVQDPIEQAISEGRFEEM